MKVFIKGYNQADNFRDSFDDYESYKTVERGHPLGGRRWDPIMTLQAKLTEKQLKQLRTITILVLVFTLGIAKCFKSIQENLKTLKTKTRTFTVYTQNYYYGGYNAANVVDHLKAIFKKPETAPVIPARTMTQAERDLARPLIRDPVGIILDYLEPEDMNRIHGFDPALLKDIFEIKKEKTAKPFDRFFEALLKHIDEKRCGAAYQELLVLIENKTHQSADTDQLEENAKTLKNEILDILITLPDEELDLLNPLLSTQQPPLEHANLIEIAQKVKEMSKNAVHYNNLDVRFKNERYIAMKAIHADPVNYAFLPIEFQKEKEIIFYCARARAHYYLPLPDEVKDNLEIMFELVKIKPYYFAYAAVTLKNNKKLALEAMKGDGALLNYCSERLKDNKDVVKAAVRNCAHARYYASRRLRNHLEIICLKTKKKARRGY